MEEKYISYEQFISWKNRAVAGFLILAVASAAGIWGVSKHANDQTISKINTYAVSACLSGISTTSKANDVVNTLITNAQARIQKDIQDKDLDALKLDNAALGRAQNDLFSVPTKAECQTPIIKK